MKKHMYFLVLTAFACVPLSSAFSQDLAASDLDVPALGDNYTVPESYYNSINEPPPQQQIPAASPQNQQQVPQQQDQQPLPADKEIEGGLGVITQLEGLRLEFEELKKNTNTDDVVGYNGGFFIKSRDGKFLLKINGRLQPKYSFDIAEEVENKHSFIIRRAYLFFSGNAYSPNFGYAFILAPALGTDPTLIGFDFFYKFSDAFIPHFWLDYLYMTSGYTLSSGKKQFITNSIGDSRYNFGDALGVAVDGKIKKFKYVMGIYNGIATGLTTNTNNEMAYSLRVEYDLLNVVPGGGGDQAHTEKPAILLGLAGGYGHMESLTSGGAAQPQSRIMLGTSDLQFKWKGYSLKLAGYFRFTDQDQFTQAQNDTGFTAETGYFFIPKKLELALRASALIDDLSNAGLNQNMQGGNESSLGGAHALRDVGGDSDNEWEYSAGLNYYFGPNGYNTKVQFQYTFFLDGRAGPDELATHFGQVQFQVQF